MIPEASFVVTIIAIAGLTATAILAVIRIVRGPTILDRMVASDVLLTTVLITVGVDMVLRDHTENIPLMIAIAATAVLATIVVARYVRRRPADDEAPQTAGVPLAPDSEAEPEATEGRQS